MARAFEKEQKTEKLKPVTIQREHLMPSSTTDRLIHPDFNHLYSQEFTKLSWKKVAKLYPTYINKPDGSMMLLPYGNIRHAFPAKVKNFIKNLSGQNNDFRIENTYPNMIAKMKPKARKP